MQPIGETKAPHRPRTALAVGALGLGIVSVVGGVWAVRLPLAQAAGEAYLRQNGIEAQLRVRALSLSGIALEGVRLGPAKAPDVTANRLQIDIRWKGLTPELKRVVATAPRLSASWKDDRLSFGQLDRLLTSSEAEAAPFALPRLGLEIRDGQLRLESQWGLATATINSRGTLGRDFTGDGQWRLQADDSGIAGPLSLRADASGLAATIRGGGTKFSFAAMDAAALRLRADIASDLDLRAITASGEVFADALAGQDSKMGQPALRIEGRLDGASANQMRWRARSDLRAADWRAGGLTGSAITAKLALDGTAVSGGGHLDLAAQNLAGPGFTAAKAQISGPLAAQSLAPLSARAELSIRAGPVAATAPLRLALREGLAGLANGALQDFAQAASEGLDGALDDISVRADPLITLDPRGAAMTFPQPAGLFARNGAALTIPLRPEGIRLAPDGSMRAAGTLLLAGPGLPSVQLTLQQLTRAADGTMSLQGDAQARWRAGQSHLQLAATAFSAEQRPDGEGRAHSAGRLEADVRSADLTVLGLRLPVDGALTWGRETRFALAGPECTQLRADRLEAGTLRLNAPAVQVCPLGGPLFAAGGDGASGGFRLGPIAWRGTLDGQPLALEAGAITGQWSGPQTAPRLRLGLARALLQQQAGITAGFGTNQADFWFGPQFRASGRFESGMFAQKDLPTRLSQLRFAWSLSPEGALAVRGGSALLQAADAEIAVHQPVRLADLELTQSGSRLDGTGRAELVAPNAPLGAFTLRHDLASGAGEAQWQTDALTFSPALQPFQISETLRGVVELARGAVSMDASASWSASAPLKARGQVGLQDLSFSTLALGPIDGVSGQIAFDDLLAMTTPANQSVTVAKINPGLPVENGTFIFQLEPKSLLRLQSATWPYAKGVLSIDPAQVQLGGEITTFNLRLSGVDLPALLDQLSLSESVRATGTVEGEFPLVFSPAGGRIENGYLAAIGAGLIAMQSPALDQTVAQGGGASQAGGVGFLQALQGFSYDELALRNVSGAIDGEITADILFSGENVAPISLPVPGGKDLVGLPYRFKVTVKAPLLQLSRSAQNALDYKGSIAQALELEQKSQAGAQTPKSPEVPR